MAITLKSRLSTTVALAEAKPGEPQRMVLGNGLRVDIRVGKDTELQLSRHNVYPAERELRTVLEHWPYPVDAMMQGKQQEHQGRFYLKAKWLTPAKLTDGTNANG